MIATVQRRRHTVARADGPVELSGSVRATSWPRARPLHVDVYPWYAGGGKQATEVRLLYDPDNLYAQFRCRDLHIFSAETKLNGDVYKDSCVEMFAGIDEVYFNLEINCCGVMHLGVGSGRTPRRLVDAVLAGQIKIATSIRSPIKAESPDDRDWWVAARLPFAVLNKFTARVLTPRPGATWRANFYRCGGRIDPQYACWSPIDTPEPDYHRPEFFGELRFA